MSNLGPREKYGIILLGIVLIVFGIYMLGIRNLEKSYAELTATRDSLVQQKEYYDALKNQNQEMQAQIAELETEISEVEASFLPVFNTESMLQYTLSVFESNGCPYLVSAQTTDSTLPQVLMPDGTLSEDTLAIKTLSLQFSTEDGVCVGQYNRTPTVNLPDGTVDEEMLNSLIEGMVWQGSAARDPQYNGFISSLVQISQIDPDCIKIGSFGVQGQNGYILMSVDINFYAASFANRVSEPNTNAPYITWAGDTGVATDAGFIGMPFIVDDPNSVWYLCTLTPNEAASTERPFATYYSAAIWSQMVSESGVAGALGIEDGNLPEAPSETPAVNEPGEE